MLRRNVGGLDRAIRLVLGLILLPMGLFLLSGHHPYALLITILGFMALLTGLIGFCGLYVPLGISTARPKGWMAQMAEKCGCGPRMKEWQTTCCTPSGAAPSGKEADDAATVRNEGR